MQMIKKERFQISAPQFLLLKFTRLTKTSLVIYFHEIRINKGTRLSNLNNQIEALIVSC